MKNKIFAALAFVGLAFTATACDLDDGSGSNYYNTVCVNPVSHLRVPYSQCNSHSSWVYYVHSGDRVPAVGRNVSNYNKSSFKKPSNATIKKNGVSTKGGTAPKVKSGPGVSVNKPKSNNGGGYNKGNSNRGGSRGGRK